MTETLIISLVTVVLSAISSMSLVNWRLKSLEKKVDIHNGYAQKFAETQTDIALIKKDIEFIKTSVEELKKH